MTSSVKKILSGLILTLWLSVGANIYVYLKFVKKAHDADDTLAIAIKLERELKDAIEITKELQSKQKK